MEHQPQTNIAANAPNGLSPSEVTQRIQSGQVNAAGQKISKSTAAILQSNICTLFNLFNLAIGIALAFVQAWTNLFFLFIIALNITIGVVQEIRGRNLVEKLTVLTKEKAQVMRGGKLQELDAALVVRDDVLVLTAGNQICADCTVIEGTVEVNESLLTGESDPVVKKKGDDMLSGSFVVSGKAYATVKHVGEENFAVKLAHEAKVHKRVNSDLLKSMRLVTKFTGFFILPIGILLFCEAFFLRNDALNSSVISSAAALLGMLPKGLVLLISIALAAGVIVLSKKNVLVQEPYAIESFARADVLCLDKTGTITTGDMTVSSFTENPNAALPCSATTAMERFVGASVDVNATANAFRKYFKADASHKVTASTPFSSERKWSSVTFDKIGTIIVGAPERLAARHQGTLPNSFHALGADGARVLYAAFATEAAMGDTLPMLTIFAAIELRDPIRSGAIETLAYFHREGVAVKVISGDNPKTVSQVAKRAGLANYDNYIDMSTVASGKDLQAAAASYTVFGRVSPKQKKELVVALKANGHTVAMMGDGVNDVLALREADCSIAPAVGSGAAKQVAQLVLTDSDFSSLPSVVAEGRRVIHNVTRVSGIFFIKTIYSVLLSVLFIILNLPFPFMPIQITLIDLAIEGYPSLFLSFEKQNHPVKERFLPAAIKSALPFAIAILLAVCVMTLLGKFHLYPIGEQTGILYLIVGLLSAGAVVKVCTPPNKLRIFLAVTSTVGYFVAVYLFSSPILPLLHLTLPDPSRVWIPIAAAAATVPFMILIHFLLGWQSKASTIQIE